MAAAPKDGRRGIGVLVRELADTSTRLVRQEVRLARLEMMDLVRRAGVGTAQVALGVVLLALGGIALIVGVILLIAREGLSEHYWLAALIIVVFLGIVAAVLAKHGAGLISPEQFELDQTRETLQEDKTWLKQQLTSGATSS